MLIGYIVTIQREELYKSVFLVSKRSCTSCCLLGVEKSCTDLVKVVLSSGV